MNPRIRLCVSILGVLTFLVACEKLSPQQEMFSQAFKAYNKGDFARAVLYLKPLVEAGHPASQLLLAKMYATGQGVPEDHGKSELLRNLAAYQVYSKGDLAPGVVRPANATLKDVSDRLDYYVGGQEAGQGKPPADLGQIIDSLGLKNMTEAQNAGGDSPAAMPNLEIEIPHEAIPSASVSSPAPAPGPARTPVNPAVRPESQRSVPKTEGSRRSEQISLGIVRQAAEQGDPQAMALLAAAYEQGFYGLTPNSAMALQWKEKASAARKAGASTEEEEALEKIPQKQLWTMIGVGLLFVVMGAILWWRSR